MSLAGQISCRARTALGFSQSVSTVMPTVKNTRAAGLELLKRRFPQSSRIFQAGFQFVLYFPDDSAGKFCPVIR
jgi:hypothetical protein